MDQMNMDLRLEADRELQDNVTKLTTLAYSQINDCTDNIENKHEAYGIAAESFQNLKIAEGSVEAEMKSFLKVLPSETSRTINCAGSIYAAAQKVATSALDLAAKCQKIMNDLYYDEPSPIERAIEEAENEENGFEDAGDTVDQDNEESEEE